MGGLVDSLLPWFLPALAVYNLCAYTLMSWGKHQARRSARRVPERVLFTIALTGGALGIIAGMYLFHHKTRHVAFALGVPAIFVLQLGLLWWFAR